MPPFPNANQQSQFALLVQQARQAAHGGQLVSARDFYRQALKIDVGNASLLLEMGVLEAQHGEFDRAKQALEKGLKSAPDDANLNFNLAEIARLKGEHVRAIKLYKRCLEHDSGYHDALYGLAISQLASKATVKAEQTLKMLIGHVPQDAAAQDLYARVLLQTKNSQAALAPAQQASQLAPQNGVYRLLVARILSELGRDDEARNEIDALLIEPASIPANSYSELALLLSQSGRMDQAYLWALKANKHDPDDALALEVAGEYHQAHGDFEAAESLYRKILAKNEDSGTALLRLAQMNRINADDEKILKRLASGKTENKKLQSEAGFAYYQLLKSQNRSKEAFFVLKTANDLSFDSKYWSAESFSKHVDDLIDWFSATKLSELAQAGHDGLGAVFITGMPRSGTTLVEQMLATNDQFFAGDEMPTIPRLVRQIGDIPQNLDDKDTDFYRQNGEKLLHTMLGMSDGKRYVSDKLPGNYAYIGLLKILLPKAKFIICTRDPQDVALSIYEQYFEKETAYTANLKAIAHVCHGFDRLTAHWQEVLPADVLLVNYEDMVTEPAQTGQKLYAHIGLEWDDKIIDNMKDVERSVSTFSHWQVRQPITAQSIGRWKQFEQELEPFIATYKDLKL